MTFTRGEMAALVGWTDNQAQNAIRKGRVPTAAWAVTGSPGQFEDDPEPEDAAIAYGNGPTRRTWARFDFEQVVAIAAANAATGAFAGCGENARLPSLIAGVLRGTPGMLEIAERPPSDLFLAIAEMDHEAVREKYPDNPDPVAIYTADFANAAHWIADRRREFGIVRAELIDLSRLINDIHARADATGLEFPD